MGREGFIRFRVWRRTAWEIQYGEVGRETEKFLLLVLFKGGKEVGIKTWGRTVSSIFLSLFLIGSMREESFGEIATANHRW